MKRIRYGMVGGGPGAFIGAVHRQAAALDGAYELVCGAFSSNADKSKSMAGELNLDPARCYGSFEEMIRAEKALPEDQRMEVVSVTTPNNMHFEPCKQSLEAGFPVICDKPMTFDVEEAENLVSLVKETGLPFGLTHNYTGYPMVKEARDRVGSGQIGEVRKVVVSYPQGWLSEKEEDGDNKQAAWRTDPKQSGISCCMGDIGTHCENLADYITGLEIESLCADITTFVKGRSLEDDGNVLLRYKGGAKGVLFASQISGGEENGLNIKVYGTKGSISWVQVEPNELWVFPGGEGAWQKVTTNSPAMASKAAQNAVRLPAGHPEGFLEAFANLYLEFARWVDDWRSGKSTKASDYDLPTVADGLRGMQFVKAVIDNGKNDNQKWSAL